MEPGAAIDAPSEGSQLSHRLLLGRRNAAYPRPDRRTDPERNVFKMTTTRRRVLVAVVVLGVAVPVIYFNVHRGPVRPQPSPAVAGLRPMPAFDLEGLDGERFSSSSLSGNVALVDFWATWCRPCLEEIPSWNDLHERYVSKGFTVLGVTVQSGWASDIQGDIEEAKLQINYPLVIGNGLGGAAALITWTPSVSSFAYGAKKPQILLRLQLSGPLGQPGAGGAAHILSISDNPALIGIVLQARACVLDPAAVGGKAWTPYLNATILL
jgi:thiol-disulfide isomerase/thioredoxin